ncbi:hypothetical protein M378DRAFT_85324 [Amanita muscaria Koide BX008]|uniref:non-specific serine/threonine protein kinase n=1 Tax=Amanita muscaria (strain Koide BX008) TaxID=946122 RepID=A0A0C2SYM6_AMAMK|nr:hypothetical protein M378DRAFT_85324 [Amanita muscaria Koide BX008]
MASIHHSTPTLTSCLGIHRGALDQTLVTTEPPQRVMERIRQVLDDMGVHVQVESEFKYRCVCKRTQRKQMLETASRQDLRRAQTPENVDVVEEVRFSVELTRLDGLHDTFSLDVRRLRGNLRSYKSLYETLRQYGLLNGIQTFCADALFSFFAGRQPNGFRIK